jgi:DNA-directed RNA polymerase specialized sigma24 family protein
LAQRRVAEAQAASVDEIHQAVLNMTTADLVRLRTFAQYRLHVSGHFGTTSWEDVLQDAMLLTLNGRRRWNKAGVDFVGHLIGVMRSTISHYEDEPEVVSDRTSPAGTVLSPLDTIETSAPSADDQLITIQRTQAIYDFFAGDATVQCILQGWREGLTLPEIQAAHQLDKTECETAVRRLRRRLPQIEGRAYV